jgi:plastocyanin
MFSCSSSPKENESAKTETTTTMDNSVHVVDTVRIQMMKFVPEQLSVNIGDTVVWMNKDIVAHTVESYQNNKFYSDTIQPQGSWKLIVIDSAAYYCSIHPAMQGQLIMQ